MKTGAGTVLIGGGQLIDGADDFFGGNQFLRTEASDQ